MIDWFEQNTADFFIAASTNTFAGSPLNRFGFIAAKDGNNYIGLQLCPISYTYQVKEYLHQKLSSPLIAGKNYCLSFYTSKADRKSYAIKNIGAFFSTNTQSTGSLGYINAIPQVANQNGYISDTTNWIQIQGCFTAIGGEQFITIGNFNSNANTDTLYTGSTNSISGDSEYAYYYIDDITLIDQTTVDVNELEKINPINVYPNPAANIINIKTSFVKENTHVRIYNTIGDIVCKENIDSLNTSFNIGNLSNGVYFYEILVGEKIIKTDKIVIIK